MQGLRIEELYGVAHASADGEWADIAQRSGLLEGYANEIVLANRDDLDGIGIFEVGSVTVSVGGKELFRSLRPSKCNECWAYL